jgi:hypothetical protein
LFFSEDAFSELLARRSAPQKEEKKIGMNSFLRLRENPADQRNDERASVARRRDASSGEGDPA